MLLDTRPPPDVAVVRRISHAELEADPAFDSLCAEYAVESSIAGMPAPKAHSGLYHHMDETGLSTTFGAYVEGELIGFAVVLVAVLPHYSVPIANTESLFVAAAHRHTGAGTKLLQAAEDAGRQRGAVGMLVSAPHEGKLSRVLAANKAYRPSNDVYFRSLTCSLH